MTSSVHGESHPLRDGESVSHAYYNQLTVRHGNNGQPIGWYLLYIQYSKLDGLPVKTLPPSNVFLLCDVFFEDCKKSSEKQYCPVTRKIESTRGING
ncbi:hypothetical protein E2C01_035018 [Portunus trituberculatus]|uniref:Uncharacterized protein n=1 Tax=Portunus trituberculatus TaxID=210409 RepID=A0A5B7F8J4_PORTR|nr:hypothetical protein [Portunus trituberculatus]